MLPELLSATNRLPVLSKSHTYRVMQARRKGGSRSVWFVFVDDALIVIRYKQIARLVNGQV